MLYRFLRPIIKFLYYILYRPKVEGKKNIPKKGGVVIASNHKNNFDCISIIATNYRTVNFLAKKELLEGKFAWLFRGMRIIPVERKAKDHTALPTAIKELNEGAVIGIFPEGTFNRTDEPVMDFKIGAVKMAHDTDSYIVPCALIGSYKLFKKRFIVRYGEPYKVKSDDLDKENKILRKKVTDLLLK